MIFLTEPKFLIIIGVQTLLEFNENQISSTDCLLKTTRACLL